MKEENIQQIKLQKDFSRIHVTIFCLLMIYLMEQFTHSADKSFIYSLYIIVPLFLVDILLNKYNFFESIIVIRIIRFVEFSIISGFMISTNYIYVLGLSLLVTVLLIIEFISTFDIIDYFYKMMCIICISIPLITNLILDGFIWSRGEKKIFASSFFMLVFLLGIYWATGFYAKVQKYYDDKMFTQSRLITNANAVNEDLKLHQEKLEKANELLGIQKIQLEAAYQRIHNANTEIMIQNEIVKYISSSLEIGKLMTLITESIINEMKVDICAIMLKPGAVNNTDIEYKITTNLGEKAVEDLSCAIKEGCFAEYFNHADTYVDNHVIFDHYDFMHSYKICSLLITPLIKDDIQIGALFVGHPKYNYFVDNIVFYEAIVSQFLIALNNANLYLKMENMAIRDSLTGIYNRGYLTKITDEYMNDSIVNQTPLSVALFDIDNFKKVNDTFGHLFGDVVIKTVAALANDITEQNQGVVGRFGGEEFVLVFPNKSLDDTFVILKDLHNKIKNKEFIHNGQSVFINVSFGVTSYPEVCKKPKNLIGRADSAMYYSKQNGRGRITVDNELIQKEVMLK